MSSDNTYYDAATGATATPLDVSPEVAESPPTTPEEAYSRALNNLSPEQMVEYRNNRMNAIRAGLPTPLPPGYTPPPVEKLDAASQIVQDAQDRQSHEDTLADLDRQIGEAQATGDWDTSRHLKYRRTDLIRAAKRAEERKAGIR